MEGKAHFAYSHPHSLLNDFVYLYNARSGSVVLDHDGFGEFGKQKLII